MTQVKICGITNQEDAWTAVRAGADAIGFVFYPRSARRVAPDVARQMSRSLPARICRVGVFVDEEPEEVRRLFRFCLLDFIQLHGKEPPEYCELFSAGILIKAVSLRSEGDLETLGSYPATAILVDAYDPLVPGGTGRTCDWTLAKRAGERHRVILAGGLNAQNILSALEAVSPLAVDVGSGVESVPGKKDPLKVKDFVAAVKGRADSPLPKGLIFEKVNGHETNL